MLWPKRMQEDNTFTIVSVYGEAFAKAPNHPIIKQLKGDAPQSGGDNENLERLKTDKYFYLELEAARTVAYQYGLDGAKWMMARNEHFDTEQIREDHEFQLEKEEEYRERFAAEQGGNVADDIEF